MRRFLLLCLFAWPVLELWAMVWVADQIGWGWTLLLLVGLSVLGVVVLRSSARSWRRVAGTAAPAPGTLAPPRGTGAAATDATFQTLAGLLLLVPGFLTGVVGLLLLLPPVRVLAAATVGRWATRRFPSWQASVTRIRVVGPFVPGEVVPGDVVPGDVVQGDVVQGDVDPDGRSGGRELP